MDYNDGLPWVGYDHRLSYEYMNGCTMLNGLWMQNSIYQES